MGGFFGAVAGHSVLSDVFFGTDYHSHLGTKSAGIAAYDAQKGLQRQIHNIDNAPFRTKFADVFHELDGTAVIGTCLAKELVSTRRGVNEGRDICVLEPEYNANSQIIFRDNAQPLIRDKHVLILMASVTTGFTANRSIEAIRYYGGQAAGIAALYSTVPESAGITVHSVYDIRDLPNYASYDYRDCPYCKAGRRLDALVNSFGYSAL